MNLGRDVRQRVVHHSVERIVVCLEIALMHIRAITIDLRVRNKSLVGEVATLEHYTSMEWGAERIPSGKGATYASNVRGEG